MPDNIAPINNALRTVVLVPTYNERDNIENIVPAILNAASVDVCVIDDNSPDGTGELADKLAANNPQVQVLHRPGKQGLGRAYLDGFRWALAQGYERIIEMDADFSHPPRFLPDLLRLSMDHDLVLGSRWIKGGGTENWPLSRRLLSRWGSFYSRTWLGVNIHDITGGFKCFHHQVLRAIDLNDIHTSGYAFQVEMTYRALKLGFSVVETPIIFVERTEGASKMSRHIAFEAMIAVPKLRFKVR
ncbi:MAG: polyprenol monophosphomannose synthase [Deltaproteobacteria bacterium]|nr:polyprenol monophosphomannose synthase [Deltaproteobacteria bacterium]